jgi:hypothetical protein
VTYATQASDLIQRLTAWKDNWSGLIDAVRRDGGVPADWAVRPWLFVPEGRITALVPKLPTMPVPPRITPLEMTQPWQHNGWNRHGEAEKPDTIPPEMRT